LAFVPLADRRHPNLGLFYICNTISGYFDAPTHAGIATNSKQRDMKK
jgi:hypothetical protein